MRTRWSWVMAIRPTSLVIEACIFLTRNQQKRYRVEMKQYAKPGF